MLRDGLVQDRIAEEQEITAIDGAVQDLIAEAVDFARDSPWPDAASATTHILFEEGGERREER